MEQNIKQAIEQALPLGKRPLILVRGIPGSGKSTFADMLCKWINRRARIVPNNHGGVQSSKMYENDEFFVDPETKIYRFDRDLCPLAAEWTIGRVAKDCLHDPHLVPIIANTFTTFSEIEPYMKLARFFNRWLVVFTMTNTGFTNVHGVPDDVLEQMSNRFISFRKEIYVDCLHDSAICTFFISHLMPIPE